MEMSRGLGAAGSVRAVVAQSATATQSGLRWSMGLVGNSDGAAWTVSWDDFDAGYTALAARSDEVNPRGRVQANATIPLGRGASAALDFTRQTTADSAVSGVLGISVRFALIGNSSLSLKYALRPGSPVGWEAGVMLAVPFGRVRL